MQRSQRRTGQKQVTGQRILRSWGRIGPEVVWFFVFPKYRNSNSFQLLLGTQKMPEAGFIGGCHFTKTMN